MNEYEEISLKELILIILKGWKMIVASVFITVGIAIIIFFTSNSQTLNSSTKNKIILKSEYTTEFGQYVLPISNADAVILLLKEDDFYSFISNEMKIDVDTLKQSITYSPISTSDYMINISVEDSFDIKTLTEQVVKYSKEFIDYSISNKALLSFENSSNIRKTNLENSKLEKLMMLTYFEEQLKNTDILVNSYTINPMYAIIASNLISLKANLAEIDYTIVKTDKYLIDIDTYLESFTSFKTYLTSSNKFDDLDLHINQSETVYSMTTKFSAKTLFPVSVILGAMIGVFIVFFKNYWLNSSKKSIN